MIDRDEAVAETLAMIDYIGKLAEQSDSLEFELAAELADSLGSVIAAAREAQSLMLTQMLVRLEDGGPRVFGGERFERARTFKERTDHDKLIAAVVDEACDHDSVRAAANHAARLMWKLYGTPSTTAKKGEVDKMSLARQAIFAKEHTGWHVEREEVGDEPGAG